MALPTEGTRWLPKPWAPAWDRYALNNAILTNDTETLQALLTGGSPNTPEGRTVAEQRKRKGVLVNLLRRWNWAKPTTPGEKRTDLPIPIGASVADLSAAQLMSEPPMFRIVKRDDKGRQRTDKGPVQERLDMIAGSDDARMTLLEGAQLAAALGGTVLKAAWDTTDPDRESVWFDAIGADCAVPEFNSAGRLVGVILWTEYPATGDKVLRHFEYHRLGGIEHAAYLGTATSVGKRTGLDQIEGNEGLLTMPGTQRDGDVVTIPTGLDRLTAAFWRNRPTRGWRKMGVLANLGRSDFELIEPAMDAYSEAWGSMMRDVRLGKARAHVPIGSLQRIGTNGQGGEFDPDREFYVELGGLDPDATTSQIKVEQPALRWEEHMGILAGLKLEILDGAGWSLSSYGNPSSAGQGGGGAVTATEVVDRTTKSERTRDEKALYFKQPANGFFRMLLELDALVYPGEGSKREVGELAIDFPDVSQVDPEKQARTFLDLSTATAISVEQMVRERRPNWDDDQVDEEIARILADMDRKNSDAADPTLIGADPNDPANPTDENAPPAPPEPVAAGA